MPRPMCQDFSRLLRAVDQSGDLTRDLELWSSAPAFPPENSPKPQPHVAPTSTSPFFHPSSSPPPTFFPHTHLMVGPRKRRQESDDEEEELQSLPEDGSEEEEE